MPLPPASSKPNWTPSSRFELFGNIGVPWGGCFEERPQPYTLSDAAADPSYPDTLYEPLLAPDEPSAWGANTYLKPKGGDCRNRTDNSLATAIDANYVFPDGAPAKGTGFAKFCKYKGQTANLSSGSGPNYGCDSTLAPLQLLTNQVAPLQAELQKMQAGGDTNLTSGLMWAWREISPNGPFNVNSNIKPYHYVSSDGTPNNKFIVFMTDGYNNWTPYYDPAGSDYADFGFYTDGRAGKMPVTVNGATSMQYPDSSNSRQYLDATFLQACSNAKAAGVVIYTVGFSIPFDPIDQEGIDVLQQCASSPSNAFIATNGNQIVDIFGAIGTQIGQLRLTN